MQRGSGNTGRTVRLPVHVGQRVRKLRRAERELAASLGRDPTDEELTTAAELTLEEIEHIREIDRDTVSLDTPVGEDGETSLGTLIPLDADGPEEEAQNNELRRVIAGALHTLPDRAAPGHRAALRHERRAAAEPDRDRQAAAASRPRPSSSWSGAASSALSRRPELAALREAA